jgi:hypothetical protein
MNARPRNSLDTKGTARGRAAGFLLPAALLFFSAVLSFGQPPASRNIWGISTGGLFPTGAFNDHVSQEGFALGLFFGRRPWNAPVYLGFELSGSFYGYAHRHEFLEGIPEVRFDVETFNNIIQGLLFLRAQPRRGAVRPFVEGLAGVSYLYTDTTISGHEFPWDEVGSDTNFSDFTVTAGAGGGLAIHLGWSRVRYPDRPRGETLLDIKVRYMAGGRAKYLKQGSIVVVGDQLTYSYDESATSFITVQAGLSFRY